MTRSEAAEALLVRLGAEERATKRKRILRVSITELMEYQRCRRQWDYQSANRQSLQRKGPPATALWMGSAIHEGLGQHIKGHDPFQAVDEWLKRQRMEIAENYLTKVGAPMSDVEWVSFDDSAQLCRDVIQNYFRHWGTQSPYGRLRAIGSETSFMIPFPHLANEHYDEVYLVGTTDALLVDDKDPRDGIWICDHKTFSQKPSRRDLELDGQFVGYCACLQVITQKKVLGFLYDGINKKVPKVPQLLTGAGPTKGRLSKARIDTTYATVVKAIEANGEDPTDPYYVEFLARQRLIDKEANPFFIRHEILVPQPAIVQWWENMEILLEEIAGGPRITFTKPWTGCWDCNVQDLCDAQMRGEDVQWLIDTNYRIDTYGTQRTLENTVSPVTVTGLDDLLTQLDGSPVAPEQAKL